MLVPTEEDDVANLIRGNEVHDFVQLGLVAGAPGVLACDVLGEAVDGGGCGDEFYA